MVTLLLVAVGGACGSVLRYLFGKAAAGWWGVAFPYGTLGVNVIGSFAAGIAFALLSGRVAHAAEWRSLILVGMLGGFTTFSAFSVETLRLWEQSGALAAGTNVALNVALSLAACAGGLWIARQAI